MSDTLPAPDQAQSRIPEIDRDQARLLLELSADLSHASTLTEVSDAIMRGVSRAFETAAGTIICRTSADGESAEIFAVSELPGQIFEEWQRFSLDADAPLAEAIRTRDILTLEARSAWEERYPHLLPLVAETGHRSQIVAPLLVAGEVIGALGIAFGHDKTFCPDEIAVATAIARQAALALDRARLFEREKEARETAENANKVKSDFLATLSHELRTPLNAIGGYTELIQLGVHGPVTPEQERALARIQASQHHIQGLINSVLEFSRIEAGVTRFDIAPVNLEQSIVIAEGVVTPQLEKKQLTYARENFDPSITVRSDAEKLRQILINLFTNAIKYSSHGGRIGLSVSVSDGTAHIKVSDTGQGIHPDNLDIIFDPFVRLSTTGATTQGVGLGLAISRSFARGMGGDLTAQSIPGKGSAFTLSVPLMCDD